MKKFKRTREAFTLIEMVIVLFIISLLLVLIIPNLGTQKNNAVKKTDEAFVTTLQTQVDMADPSITDLKGLHLKGEQAEKAEGYIIEDGKVVKKP
ncbi:prepilin-type N-terminal cleavage/methylation domain-containing protein [Companilactobacillus baiquanensis]|uniref:Prepilin-type N-terminal cleavage/methylation domain-containing protein n=1 Tax=Companilactobacillus baiquanensis TaxID=2486005 RepID=A0ABW1UWC3_9LACO|nr:prepilin-type N-terminal cleavage/methylation domain-containing protein [Companilactobacillus baiquanensis]